MQQLIIIGVFFLFLYLMMIRPQQKQQKQRKEMLSNLKKGDTVITIGGIQGVIKSFKEDKLVLRIAGNVNITLLKSAVGQVTKESKEQQDEQPLLEESKEEAKND